MTDISEEALRMHKALKGKIAVIAKDSLESLDKLKYYYTPGVAAVSRRLTEHPEEARDYTWTNNSVAVISDGSAVLGLGNIGPLGALPVMEGKCMIFKHFADIDAVPIVLDVHTPEAIIAAITAIAPSFGAINLEDIAAPICFEVETRLAESLPIPVMHDDQHGTATVVLAGLINAAKLTGRTLSDCKVVLVGAGAAGVAIAKLLNKYAQPQIIAVDSKGIISRDRDNLNDEKQRLLEFTNQQNINGSLEDAVQGTDIFIGVSQPRLLTPDMIKSMQPDPIVFALANPDPEIYPEEAKAAGAAVVATGRSDFPNQVNNALVYPGIFRGALSNRVRQITDEHKIAAAEVVAGLVTNIDADHIIPSIGHPDLVARISQVVR